MAGPFFVASCFSLFISSPRDIKAHDDIYLSKSQFNHLQRRIGGDNLKKETGTGKWFKRLSAYGYINPGDGSKEVIVPGSSKDDDKKGNIANNSTQPKAGKIKRIK